MLLLMARQVRLKFIDNPQGLDTLEPPQPLCVRWHHAQHCWCLGRCRGGTSTLVISGSPGAVLSDRPTPCGLVVWTVFWVVFVSYAGVNVIVIIVGCVACVRKCNCYNSRVCGLCCNKDI